ncbi:guanylate cyclase domain-containing protein, partial [Haematococcus lacustris]
EYLRFLHALDVLSPGLLSTIDDLLGMSTSSTLPAAKVCHTMTASFKLDLSLTPLTIQGSSQGPHGQKTCVVIDHHLRGHEAQLQHRLLSDHMLLTHADMMVTLCDLTGQVLRQNAAAQAYAGCLQDPIVPGMESLVVQTLLCAQAVVPRPPTSQAAMGPAAALAYAAAANCSRAPRSHNVLQLLLRHEPSLLHDLLEEVLVGHTWEGVVRVPASLISASHLPATDLPATGTSLIAQTKEHTVTSCDLSPHPCPANQSADKPVCSESINNTEVPLAPDMEQPNKSRRKLSRTTSFYVAQHRAPKSSSIQPPLAPTPEAVTTQSLSPSQAVTDSTAVKVLGQGLSRSQSNSPAKPLVVPNGLDKLRGPCSQPLTPGWHMASPQPAVTPTHVQLRSQAHPYSSTPGSAPPQVISGAHGLAAPHSASTAGQPSSAPWSMAQPYASHPPGPKGLDFSLASRELVSGPGRQPLTLFDRQASPKLHKLMKAESSVLSSFERQATDPCLACPPHPQSDPTPLRLCCADTTTDGRGRSKLALGHPTARTGKHSPPTGHSGKTDSSPEAVQRQRGSPEAAWHSPPPAHPGPTFPAASSQPSYAQQLQMDEGVTDNTFTLSAASPEPVAPITGFPSQTTSVHPSRPGYMSSIGADPAAAGPESSAPSGSARTLSLLRLHSRTAGQRPPPRSTSRSFMLSGASSLSPLTHPASSGTSPRLSMLLNPCKSSEQQTSAGSGVFSTVQRQPTSGTDNLLQSSQCQTPTHQPTGSVLETSSSTSFSGPKHRSLPSDQLCWHSIKATPVYDPVSGHQVLVLAQKDVTHQVEAEARLTQVMEASLGLLELIFPRHVIEHMTLGQASRPEKPISGSNAVGPKIDFDSLASHHDCVTILFTDICGFTAMSKEVEAVQVMNFLNTLYSAYDHLVDKHGVYKLETVGAPADGTQLISNLQPVGAVAYRLHTVRMRPGAGVSYAGIQQQQGDCYVVVGGLMQKDAEGFVAVNRQSIDREAHAMAVLDFALDMMSMASTVVMPHNQQPVVVRCGIHSGPIVSGVVGHRMPKF